MVRTTGIDTLWMIRFMAEVRRLVALGIWGDMRRADDVEQLIAALDKAPIHVRPKPPHHPPITKHATRALRYGVAYQANAIAAMLLPVVEQLAWQPHPLVDNWAMLPLIGSDGYAPADNIEVGLMLFGEGGVLLDQVADSAELYFVVSGQARFQQHTQPWRTCPIGQYVFHTQGTSFAIENGENVSLLLYTLAH